MLIRRVVLSLFAGLLVTGLACTPQPAPDGGGDQNGGGDGGDGIDIEAVIGFLTANATRNISATGDDTSVSASAVFTEVEDLVEDPDVEQKVFGDCVVTTVALDAIDSQTPEIEYLDAGALATVDNGTNTATLARPAEGSYSAASDLSESGFAAGQTFTFDFPGGEDVSAFTASVTLPGDLTVSSPDLAAGDLTIDRTSALTFTWTASGTADQVYITISATDATSFATIVCTVDDTGSATVPQGAMECLPENPTSTTVSVQLSNTESVDVELVSGGTRAVHATGQTGISRTILPGFDPGYIGGFDPCDFIPCPGEQTCNPETFLCE